MSLFFYVTYKLVLLKDKRLGVLYYVLALLALLYTVVEIFIRKGYMDVSLYQPKGLGGVTPIYLFYPPR